MAKRSRPTRSTVQRRADKARSLAMRAYWADKKAAALARSERARHAAAVRWASHRVKVTQAKAIKKPAKPPARVEFAVSADYRTARINHAVSVQLSIVAPGDTDKRGMKAAIEFKIENGYDPDGFEIQIVDWREQGVTRKSIDQDRDWRAFRKPLSFADFHILSRRKT